MFMQAIVDDQMPNVPYTTMLLPKTKDQVDITTVEVFFMAVKANAVVHVLLQKQSRMNYVAMGSEPQDIIIITRFLPAKNLPAFAVDINAVTKESVPLWMLSERGCNFAQGLRSINIISIENCYDVSRSAPYALVHCVIMTAVLFRDPLQMRIAAY